MQNSTDAAARRPVILYIIIAIALFAALVLGVRWAKSRAAYYGQPQTGQNQPAQQQQQTADQGGQSGQQNPGATQQPQQSTPAPSTPVPAPDTASVPTTHASPSRVPSTGPEQVFLPIISISAVVFAGLSYARARRRLQALAQ